MSEDTIRKIIEEHKADWWEVDKMDSHDAEIQNIIAQLDAVAVEYENKWGVGILQKECRPELLEKWVKQCEKFRTALRNGDANLVRDLALGFKRAYEVLEKDCLERDIKPLDACFLSLWYRGREVVVCATQDDVRRVMAQRRGEDSLILSMSEVAQKFLKDSPALVTSEKSPCISGKSKPEYFDFDEGDEIPFV